MNAVENALKRAVTPTEEKPSHDAEQAGKEAKKMKDMELIKKSVNRHKKLLLKLAK